MTFSLDPDDMTPDAGEQELPRPARTLPGRKARGTSDGARASTPAAARTEAQNTKLEGELATRLQEALERIGNALKNRGEEDLSSALLEDAKGMAESTVNLTRRIKFLRGPLLMFLTVAEPALSFGRVVRIIADKLRGWRGERQTAEDEPNG